ncbi:MAG: hypothetical protein RML46_11265 [Anaerolineae bacterium]|nr:hypothetical protein [Anaerolineae bacterium]
MWDISHIVEICGEQSGCPSDGQISWLPPADLSLFLALPDWEIDRIEVGAHLTLRLISPSGMALDAQLLPLKEVVEPPSLPSDIPPVARFAHATSFWAYRVRRMVAFPDDLDMAPVFLLPPGDRMSHPVAVAMSRFHAYIEPIPSAEVYQPLALTEGALRVLEQAAPMGLEIRVGPFGALALCGPGLRLVAPSDGRRIYREPLFHVLAQVEQGVSAQAWASPRALFAHLRPHQAVLSHHRDEHGLSLHIQGDLISFRSPHPDGDSIMSTSSVFLADRGMGEGRMVILRRMVDLLMTFLEGASQEVELRIVGNILVARSGDRQLILAGVADS